MVEHMPHWPEIEEVSQFVLLWPCMTMVCLPTGGGGGADTCGMVRVGV